jgi:hypothetical protein
MVQPRTREHQQEWKKTENIMRMRRLWEEEKDWKFSNEREKC